MQTAGKWVMGIVTGGVLFGALLGTAARPDMKEPPVPSWQLTGRAEIAASDRQPFFEAAPEDLNPYGGYRPDLDYTAEVWALPLPDYDLAALRDEPLSADWPTVSYGYTSADRAAEEAEDAARDAQSAQQRESDTQAEPGAEVRKSELALAGLY
jgi:hypothetical protein